LKFSLLHPSRSRPTKSFDATQKWIQNASSTDFEVIVSIDDNDPHRDQYLAIYSNVPKAKVIINKNRSAVDAINNAAKESIGEILIVVSDDTGCTNQWDTIISKATEGHSDYILKVYDGVQKWIITMPIMDREYYNRYGFVYYPAFKHMFVDTFLTHQADALKKVIWRNDITIPHHHYSVTKSGKDEVSMTADSTLYEGERVYKNLVDQNLLIEGNIWDLSEYAAGHIQWCKNKNWI
jgi:hypothetical protein